MSGLCLGYIYPFPRGQHVLGCDLGPAINTGLAMTQKILKKNGQVVYCSMVWSLTEDRYKSEDMRAKWKAFDENVNKVLGKAYNPDDFKDNLDMLDVDTPTYNMYKDDDKEAYSQVLDIDDVSPDTYNCYVGNEVELLIGDKVMSGKVKRQKR